MGKKEEKRGSTNYRGLMWWSVVCATGHHPIFGRIVSLGWDGMGIFPCYFFVLPSSMNIGIAVLPLSITLNASSCFVFIDNDKSIWSFQCMFSGPGFPTLLSIRLAFFVTYEQAYKQARAFTKAAM